MCGKLWLRYKIGNHPRTCNLFLLIKFTFGGTWRNGTSETCKKWMLHLQKIIYTQYTIREINHLHNMCTTPVKWMTTTEITEIIIAYNYNILFKCLMKNYYYHRYHWHNYLHCRWPQMMYQVRKGVQRTSSHL